MEFKVIDANSFENYVNKKTLLKEEFLDFNLSTAYHLKDGAVFVKPLNPFGKCLLLYNTTPFDKYKIQKAFPLIDNFESLYLRNKEVLNILQTNKVKIINDLYSDILNTTYQPKEVDLKLLENLIEELFKKKSFEKYKLNLIVLIADFIHTHKPEFKLGILQINQFINPIYKIIIITDSENKKYFNLEQEIDEKVKDFGISHILQRAVTRSKYSDKIEEIIKIIEF